MSREAMQQALDAIEGSGCKVDLMAAADALRAALAEQAQPVAWKHRDHREILDADPREWGRADEPWIPLYTTPPAPVVPQPLKELPPLPEPWITDTEECGTSHDGESLHQDIPLFGAGQMRDYARAALAEQDRGSGWCPIHQHYKPCAHNTAAQAEPLTIERLRDALVASRIIPPEAVEDPDDYDDGLTLHRIEALYRRIT